MAFGGFCIYSIKLSTFCEHTASLIST